VAFGLCVPCFLEPIMHLPRIFVPALVLALACGRTRNFDVEPQRVGGAAAAGAAEAAAATDVDASVDGRVVDVVPVVCSTDEPSPIEEPPDACMDLETCTDISDPVPLVLTMPSSVELRDGLGGRILGYDSEARQFRAFQVAHKKGSVVTPAIAEPSFGEAFEPRFDRVVLSKHGVLACEGQACFAKTSSGPWVALPAQLAAQGMDDFCVIGHGVMCFAEDGSTLAWRIAPGTDSERALAIAKVAGWMVVSTPSDVRFYDACGKLANALPLPSGQPIVRIVPKTWEEGPNWAGLSADGTLINGSKLGLRECNAQVSSLESVPHEFGSGPSFVIGRQYFKTTYYRNAPSGVGVCEKQSIPPGVRASSHYCNQNFGPTFFDSQHVYAPPINCWSD
jgi:hypothetical protein